MEFTKEFENEFEKMPFSWCIDKDLFYKEYLEAPKIPSLVLFLKDTKYKTYENLSEIESIRIKFIWNYRTRQHYHINPTKRKQITQKYLIPDIRQTKTYKQFSKVDEVYNNFFQVLKNKISEINRYEEPHLHAKNIIREIEFFPDEIKIKIIDAIINNNNNMTTEFIRMQYTNPNYTEDNENLLNALKNHLFNYKEKLQENIKVTEKQPNSNEPEPQTTNIDLETGIDIDLLKYLSENFTSSDKRVTERTKFNYIYFYFFPIKDEDSDDKVKRANHESYKLLIKREFDFDYGNSQIKVHKQDTHKTQLTNMECDYRNLKKE